MITMENDERRQLRLEQSQPIYSSVGACENLIINNSEQVEDAPFANGCYQSINGERHTHEESQGSLPHVAHDIHVYATRWWLLLVTSMCVAMYNAVWATWGPIAKSAEVSHSCNSLAPRLI